MCIFPRKRNDFKIKMYLFADIATMVLDFSFKIYTFSEALSPFCLGLAELEYPLAEGTTLGNWKLIVEPERDFREMKIFAVAHYGRFNYYQ